MPHCQQHNRPLQHIQNPIVHLNHLVSHLLLWKHIAPALVLLNWISVRQNIIFEFGIFYVCKHLYDMVKYVFVHHRKKYWDWLLIWRWRTEFGKPKAKLRAWILFRSTMDQFWVCKFLHKTHILRRAFSVLRSAWLLGFHRSSYNGHSNSILLLV